MPRPTWLTACREYKARTGKWIVPRMGCPEYAEVAAILVELRNAEMPGTVNTEAVSQEVAERIRFYEEQEATLKAQARMKAEYERQQEHAATMQALYKEMHKPTSTGLAPKTSHVAKVVHGHKILSFM